MVHLATKIEPDVYSKYFRFFLFIWKGCKARLESNLIHIFVQIYNAKPIFRCPSGTYIFNQSSCEGCTIGRYAPTAIDGACLACPAGSRTKVVSRATTCSACNSGTASEALSVNCTDCEPGYASGPRASICAACSKGSYTKTRKSSACVKCSAGRAATATARPLS